MTRITKPVEERRQEILDTARKFFIANGFDKTAIADISAELNIAQGLIYRYFSSKTELLYAVAEKIAVEHLESTKNLIDAQERSAFDCLEILIESDPDIEEYGELIPSLIKDPGMKDYVGKSMTLSVSSLLEHLIEKGNVDGSWHCTCPKVASKFILQGASGFVKSAQTCESREKTDELKHSVTEIIYRILGVPDINSKH